MNDFYYITRVRIKRKTEEDPAYFGRGVADLLHGIEKYHSLNQAAKEMGKVKTTSRIPFTHLGSFAT